MKLSPEQIERLYEFTRQHYVEYYDLQTELVDHLANAVEEQWLENPKLSFETALDIEFKKFGVFGFTDVLKNRKKTLEKKYLKIIWSNLKEYFRIPRIIATILSVYLVFLILENTSILEDFSSFLGKFGGYLFYVVIYFIIYKQKKKRKKAEKKWLFKEIIYSYGLICFFSIFILNSAFVLIRRFLPEIIDNSVSQLFISTFLMLYILLCYIVLKVIPSKAQEYLKETYPEYEMAE